MNCQPSLPSSPANGVLARQRQLLAAISDAGFTNQLIQNATGEFGQIGWLASILGCAPTKMGCAHSKQKE
jgi:hypothetical protein